MGPWVINELISYTRIVRDLSRKLAIPSINEEDGFVLQSIAFSYASRTSDELLVLDLGAGIGYSTIWLVAGIAPICNSRKMKCRVIAVEQNSTRAEHARRVLSALPVQAIDIEVVEMNAIEYLEKLSDCEIDIVFVDIDKDEYIDVLKLLAHKLKPYGIALFHNAFVPSPPQKFFKLASSYPWISIIIPTTMGILGALKNARKCV